MKAKSLIIGILGLAIGPSACQNKSSETGEDHTSMERSDSNNMNMGS